MLTLPNLLADVVAPWPTSYEPVLRNGSSAETIGLIYIVATAVIIIGLIVVLIILGLKLKKIKNELEGLRKGQMPAGGMSPPPYMPQAPGAQQQWMPGDCPGYAPQPTGATPAGPGPGEYQTFQQPPSPQTPQQPGIPGQQWTQGGYPSADGHFAPSDTPTASDEDPHNTTNP